MNKSPDTPTGRPGEAELEDRLLRAETPPADPELAADWALRRELRALAPEDSMPATLRRAVLERATSNRPRGGSRWPGLPVAMAASLAGLLALAVVLRPVDPGPEPVPGASAEDLRLALATIDRTSRRAMTIAGREVGEQLAEDFSRIEIQRLPYTRLLTSFRLSPPRTHQPEEN